MGFEALLWGRPVHCFGMPFYAGWGLTQDRLVPPERRTARPGAGGAGARRSDRRQSMPRSPQPSAGADRGSDAGHRPATAFAEPGASPAGGFRLHPLEAAQSAAVPGGKHAALPWPWQRPGRRAEAVVVWGRRARPRLLAAVTARGFRLLQVEDGFLRSVGLGAELIDPISWVVDQSGMYYDATSPSDLEVALAAGRWSEPQLARARGAAASGWWLKPSPNTT